MNKWTEEQVESELANRFHGSRALDMLRAYAALLRERESASAPAASGTGSRIDAALDKVLRAAGTRLSNYMPLTQDELRKAMREVMSAEYIAGSNACEAAIEYARLHAPSNAELSRRQTAKRDDGRTGAPS